MSCRPRLLPFAPLTCALVVLGCATGPRPGSSAAAVQEEVYPRPLDEVLAQTATLLTEQGWQVQRRGDRLGTLWRPEGSGSASGLRVEGVRVDADHSTVAIEGVIAVSLGSSIEDRQATSTSLGADVTAGADRLEAPSTLGAPPPGLVAISRGRDEALERALLERLDPRAARALESSESRARGEGRQASPVDCGRPLPGGDDLLAARRLILLADVPGTREVPALVGDLACRAATAGIRTVVGLELWRAEQELLETYLASTDTEANRAAFLAASKSFALAAPSPASTAELGLLDRLRTLRDTGLPVRVFAFGEPADAPGAERARARTVERQRRLDLDAVTLVLVRRPPAGGEVPLAAALTRWGLRPLPLDLRLSGGTAWRCPAPGAGPGCGEAEVPARPPLPGTGVPRIDLFAMPDADGFLGAFFVGVVSPSPPPGGRTGDR